MELSMTILKEMKDISSYEILYDRKDAKIVQMISNYKEKFDFHGTLDDSHIQFLGSIGTTLFPVITNKKLLDYLRTKYPNHYPTPNLTLKLADIIQRSEEYLIMAGRSTKKRKMVVLQDVYYFDPRTGKDLKIIPYNSFIGEKSLEALKRFADHDKPIEVMDSEQGALVFIPDVKDFKLKIDLFAILATFDFPIYDAASLKDAMTLYTEKTPRLVIIANLDTNIDSKEFLIELEEFDPFVKKMNYTESPASNKKKEIDRVRHHYDAGYREIIAMMKDNEQKENLPEEIKISILNSIKELEQNFSPMQFYEKAFALKQFGRYFNIKMYWNMMINLKKKHFKN